TLAAITGTQPEWFRPPFGALSSAALRSAGHAGLTTVLWTAWGRDWRERATPASVVATLTKRPLGGATVLLHDSDCTSAPGSWRATLGALDPLVAMLTEAAITVGPLRQHGV